MTEAPNRLYYSRPEAARLMGLSIRSIDKLLADGRLPSTRVLGRRLISRDALVELGGRCVALKMDYV